MSCALIRCGPGGEPGQFRGHGAYGVWLALGGFLPRSPWRTGVGPLSRPCRLYAPVQREGVCAEAWVRNEAVVVPNVDDYPGHVVCSAESRSELVLPVRDEQGHVHAVFDVDSTAIGDFDQQDADRFQRLIDAVGSCFIDNAKSPHV